MNEAQPCEAAPERLPVGMFLLDKNQRFELVGHRPHTRLDGTATELTVWRGPCAICGEAFHQAHPRDGPRSVLRTCAQHRGKLKRRRRQKIRETQKAENT